MSNFKLDPLNEEKYTVFPGLIHKHQDRILVELNLKCPVVCSFCTRKRKGISENNFDLGMAGWKMIEEHIKNNPKIREVILSGGEPLISAELLIEILERLKNISQIKIIRIHTRMPVTAPLKIDEKLFKYFEEESKNRVLYLSIHCDHKNELTDSVRQCIERLRLSGVILYSQSVFLKNVNDTVKDLKDLFETLLELGVRPYYIYQCDKIEDWQEFAVPLNTEKRLMRQLNKEISGLACPIFIVDSEDGKNRIF